MQGIDPASPSSYSQRHVTPTVASRKWIVPLFTYNLNPPLHYVTLREDIITELRSLWLLKKRYGSNSQQSR